MLRKLGIAVLVLGAVVACGRPAADQPERLHTNEGEPPVWVDLTCPTPDPVNDPLGTARKRGGVPADFAAVAVVRCRTETRVVPGEGSWLVQITERADTPVPELVELLRRPSDPPPTGEILCPAVAYEVPYILLVGADGKALLPTVPTETCGKPHEEVTDLIDALPYRPVTETRVSQVVSQKSLDTGCEDAWKDMITIVSPAPGPAPRLPADSGDIRVCVYTVAGDVGNLETGYLLGEPEASALRAALAAAGPAAPCDTPHTRFAVLRMESGAYPIAELDGCYRVQILGTTLSQLSADVVGGLTR